MNAPLSISEKPLLIAENLSKHFDGKKGIFQRSRSQVTAVDDVDLAVFRGQTLGLVGESGCGKSTLARTLVRLYRPDGGRIYLNGKDISDLSGPELRSTRRNIQYIFQDPVASLDSRRKVGDTIAEGLDAHMKLSTRDREKRILEILDLVGLPSAAARRLPHEFSGGQRQRIGIARALILKPAVLVADEPVSALDVSVQSQVLNLLVELQEQFDMTYVFIAHDLAVVGYIADRIAVMYLGRIVEEANADSILNNPQHPYTRALISSIPRVHPSAETKRIILHGEVPSPINPPSGCSFRTRCSEATDLCTLVKPPLEAKSNGANVACHFVK